MDKSQGTDTQNGGYAMTYRQIADATGIATSAGGSRTCKELVKLRARGIARGAKVVRWMA